MGARLTKTRGLRLEGSAAERASSGRQESIFAISYRNTYTAPSHQTNPKQLCGEVTVTNSEEKTAETCDMYSPDDINVDAVYHDEVNEQVETEDDPYDLIPTEFGRNDQHRRSTCTTRSVDSAFSDRSSVLTGGYPYCKGNHYCRGHQSCGGGSSLNIHHRTQGNSCAVESSTQQNVYTYPGDTKLTCGCQNEREIDMYFLASEPEQLIPYMIDTFRPLVEGSILVIDVLPHLLTIIDDPDAIFQKDKLSHKEGARMLLQCIEKCKDVGKWQMFVDSLISSDYKYIARLLKGETEEDQSINRRILKLFTPQIINRIDPKEFIDHLYEKEVITETDKEEVEREHTNRGEIAASFMLLDRIPRRLSDWYDIFIDVLKKCKMEDMAKTLTVPEVTITDKSKCAASHGRPPLPPRDISLSRTRNISESNSQYNNLTSKASHVNKSRGTAENLNRFQNCQKMKTCTCGSNNIDVHSTQAPNPRRTIDDVEQEHHEHDKDIKSLEFYIAEMKLRRKKKIKERLEQELGELIEEDDESYHRIPEKDETYLDIPADDQQTLEEPYTFEQISNGSIALHINTGFETVSPVDSSIQDSAIKNSISERVAEKMIVPDTKGILIESDNQIDNDEYIFSEIYEGRIDFDRNTDNESSDEVSEIAMNDRDTIINDTTDTEDKHTSAHIIHKALEKMTNTLKNHITDEIQKLSMSETYSSNNYTDIEQMCYENMPMPLYSLSHRQYTTQFGLAQGHLFGYMSDHSSILASLSCEIEDKLKT